MNLNFLNPHADIRTTTNRLTHWEQPGATYFFTFRLADSLPAHLLAQWADERDAWLKENPEPWSDEQEREYHRKFSGTIEHWLDDGHGECLLRRPDVRAAVERVFTKFDCDRYWHHAGVLMPNHVHLLVSLREGVELPKLLKAWKGTSSYEAGRVLQRSMTEEAFWQKDYFDRLVRDGLHFWNCARYVRRNPVKARLREGEYSLWLSDDVREFLDAREATRSGDIPVAVTTKREAPL